MTSQIGKISILIVVLMVKMDVDVKMTVLVDKNIVNFDTISVSLQVILIKFNYRMERQNISCWWRNRQCWLQIFLQKIWKRPGSTGEKL